MSKVTNQELVEKAAITTDALAAAGKLSPAQSDRFIDFVVDESVLKNNARIVRFRNESLEIDKIGVGTRVSIPKAEAKDPQVRRGITTSKISLTPKEIMTPFSISDNFREVNIEGDQVEDTIIRLMGTQTSNDLEELAVNGDTAGHARLEGDLVKDGSDSLYIRDPLMALFNGWSRRAETGHVVDADGQNIGLSIFGKAVRAMPTKFRRNMSNLRFFLSPDLMQLYQEKLSTRATAMGDDAAKGATSNPYGIPAIAVPLWGHQPLQVEHVTLTGTTPVTLRSKNISNVVVHASTLAKTPTAPYVEDTDYSVDLATGVITRIGGAISSGALVKVTYNAAPQMILTHRQNMIVGIGRDVRIEKDRDIYAGEDQYAITTKFDVQFEEVDAVVKVENIGVDI